MSILSRDEIKAHVQTGAITSITTDGRSGWPAWRPGTLPTIATPAGPGGTPAGPGGGGRCAGQPPGVDTARCLLAGIDATACDTGAVEGGLEAFLTKHDHQVDGALAAAAGSDKPKRRMRQIAKARRGLGAIATRVMKDAGRKRHPLAPGCRDAILSLVGAVRQAAFGG